MRDLLVWLAYAVAIPASAGLLASIVALWVRALGRPTRFVWVTALIIAVLTPLALAVRARPPAAPPSFAEAARAIRQATAAVALGPAELSTFGAGRRFRTSRMENMTPYEASSVYPITLWEDAVGARHESEMRAIARIRRQRLTMAGLLSGASLLFGWLCAARAWLAVKQRQWDPFEVDGETVLVNDTFGPAVLGLIRPVIVSPAWLLDLAPAARRMVLRHEREHITAGDPWLRLVCLGSLVAMPWNPAIWWIVRRCQEAIELDCDRRVVNALGQATVYCQLLLMAAARKLQLRHPALLTVGLSTGTLRRRLEAVLAQASSPTRSSSLRWAIPIAATAVLASAFVPRVRASVQAATARLPVPTSLWPSPPPPRPVLGTDLPRTPVDTAAIKEFLLTRMPDPVQSPVPVMPVEIYVDSLGVPRFAGGRFTTPIYPPEMWDGMPPCAGFGPWSQVETIVFPAGTVGRAQIIVCQIYRVRPPARVFPLTPDATASDTSLWEFINIVERPDQHLERYIHLLLSRHYPEFWDWHLGDPASFVWFDVEHDGTIRGTGRASTYQELVAHESPGAELRAQVRVGRGIGTLVLYAQYPPRARPSAR